MAHSVAAALPVVDHDLGDHPGVLLLSETGHEVRRIGPASGACHREPQLLPGSRAGDGSRHAELDRRACHSRVGPRRVNQAFAMRHGMGPVRRRDVEFPPAPAAELRRWPCCSRRERGALTAPGRGPSCVLLTGDCRERRKRCEAGVAQIGPYAQPCPPVARDRRTRGPAEVRAGGPVEISERRASSCGRCRSGQIRCMLAFPFAAGGFVTDWSGGGVVLTRRERLSYSTAIGVAAAASAPAVGTRAAEGGATADAPGFYRFPRRRPCGEVRAGIPIASSGLGLARLGSRRRPGPRNGWRSDFAGNRPSDI